MNRIILSFLIIAICIVAPITPSTSSAQSSNQSSNQELIKQLLLKVAELEEQLRVALQSENASKSAASAPNKKTIVPPTQTEPEDDGISIQVTSPNGGDDFTAGEKMEITWNSEGIPAKSKVSIGLDRRVLMNTPWGEVYGHYGQTPIHLNTPNDGKFTWTIPSWIPESTEYMIDISGTAGNEEGMGANDKSDGVFSIDGGKAVEIEVTPSEVEAGSSVRIAININDQDVAREADALLITLKNQSGSQRAASNIVSLTDSENRLYVDIPLPASASRGTWVVNSVEIFGNNSILTRYWYPDEINKTFTVTSR